MQNRHSAAKLYEQKPETILNKENGKKEKEKMFTDFHIQTVQPAKTRKFKFKRRKEIFFNFFRLIIVILINV